MKNYPRYGSYEPRETPDLTKITKDRERGKMSGDDVPSEDEITPPAATEAVERDSLRHQQGKTEHEEELATFKERVDSITSLKLPRGKRKTELGQIVRKLEAEKQSAQKVDQHFGEQKPAAEYLQRKAEEALAELAKLSLWPE